MKQANYDVLLVRILAATAALAVGVNAQAADAPATEQTAGAAADSGLEEIVVTASGGDKTQLNTSVSVTSLNADLIKDFQPTSEAEVFRMIPGIQVAGTAGPGGNSNIAVRGLPVATGGSPFVQIQEDGLPTVLFGDMNFGNNDYWTHFDSSVDRVEAVRGGSASTFASQAPGAVINYISNYGQQDGGFVQLSRGLGYDDNKVDFRYGGAASDTVHFHVGGYVHTGRGALDAGYNVSNSAQVKANLTKDIADGKGYIRFLLKVAKTQEPNYTGAPALANVNGTTVSDIRPYPGFDGRDQSNYSSNNQSFYIVNRDGQLERVETTGISTHALALGTQLHYEFNDDVKLDDNMRWTSMGGSFNSPFFNPALTSSVIGSTVNGQTVASIRYANGPNAGQLYTGSYLNNNTDVSTNIRDVGSFANDLALSGKFDLAATKLTARGGLFMMTQHIAEDWHTNQTYSEMSGNNPAMLDLYSASGALLTANGIAGFNNNWGSCCSRDYDLAYTDTAPYLNLDWDLGRFDLDGSTRFENVHASGWDVSGGALTSTDVVATSYATSAAGTATTVAIPTMLADGTQENLDYSKNYVAWSLGGLFKWTDDLSVFARASKGGRFNGDRQIASGKINGDGSLNAAGNVAAVDFVHQYELGLKNRGDLWSGRYTLEATLLKGDFKQSTYELSATKCPGGAGGCVIDAKYRSNGMELFATYQLHAFSLVANATFTHAEKLLAGASTWQRSDGMPNVDFTISAGYDVLASTTVGLSVTGRTSTLDSTGYSYPGAETFSGYVRFRPLTNLELGVQGYNLFNTFDLRGNGGIASTATSPAVISGAPAVGRTFMGTIKLSF